MLTKFRPKWLTDRLKPTYEDEIIQFYCDPALYDVIPHPVPAFKMMPEWYKNLATEVDDNGRDTYGAVGLTAKKCMPLMDIMTAGYHILMPCDVNVTVDERGLSIFAPDNRILGEVLQFHDPAQAGGVHNSPNGKMRIPKFINPWIIKTRKGWSSRFDPPPGRMEERFTALPAVVDTDLYPKQVNFPVIWHKHDYDGIIKAGTPIVTVTPFQRTEMPRYPVVRKMTQQEAEHLDTMQKRQMTRGSHYSTELRAPRNEAERRKQEAMVGEGCPFHRVRDDK